MTLERVFRRHSRDENQPTHTDRASPKRKITASESERGLGIGRQILAGVGRVVIEVPTQIEKSYMKLKYLSYSIFL